MGFLSNLFFEKRGYTPDFFKNMEQPSTFALKDVDIMADRLHSLYQNQNHIVILPDFDMDGIMSGVVGYAGLSELGFNVSLYYPSTECYGFDETTIDDIRSKYPDVHTILTCDVGTDCHSGITHANNKGLHVLVTDHHTVLRTPPSDIIVNPMRSDDLYEHKSICGAFVLWQVLSFYAKRYRDVLLSEQIDRLRVFAGIGTISDSMPLLYENRILVKDMLSFSDYFYSDGNPVILNNMQFSSDICRRAFKGLFALFSFLAAKGKITKDYRITEGLFAFYVAPLFNSCKRMNADMSIPFGVFFSDTVYSCLNTLWQLNEDRKTLVEKYMDELESLNGTSEFIFVSEAPAGILGLLSTKKMEQTGLPCICVTRDSSDDSFHGSGRSPYWYNFIENVKPSEDIYIAGHANAFGVRIRDAFSLCILDEFLKDNVKKVYESYNFEEGSRYDFTISTLGDGDTIVNVPLFFEFLDDIADLRPFGSGLSEPYLLFRCRGRDVSVSQMGANKQHLKFSLGDFDVLMWNTTIPDLDSKLAPNSLIEFGGTLSQTWYQGDRGVNFVANSVNIK